MVDCQHPCTSTTPSHATCPTCTTPCTTHKLIVPPVQPIPTQPIQPVPMQQLNWSCLKQEFTGKLDEGVEAHLLRTNDWMDTHAFPEGAKVQYFCLILVGKARLWYELLRPINVDWDRLQNQFCSNIPK